MRRDWNTSRLENLCQIEIGKTPRRGEKKYWDKEKKTNNVWLSIADLAYAQNKIINDSKEYISNEGALISKIIKKGTLLVSFKLTLGRMAFAGRDLYSNEAIAALAVKHPDQIIKEYLYYFFLFFDWNAATKGDIKVKGKTLNKTKLKNIIVHFPTSLPEQRRIVAILDQAFASVDKTIENTKINLESAHELFESYVNNIFTNPDDEWEKKKLEEVSENLDSKRVPVTKRDRQKGIYPYYGASGIVDYINDYIFDEDLLLVSEDGANLLARTYPIAFSISGKSWVNNHAHVLKFENLPTQRFVEYFLNSIKLDEYVTGMAQPKLNQKMLNSIAVPFPNVKIRNQVVNRLDTLSTETRKLEGIYRKKLVDLEELRQSFLHKAVVGEL